MLPPLRLSHGPLQPGMEGWVTSSSALASCHPPVSSLCRSPVLPAGATVASPLLLGHASHTPPRGLCTCYCLHPKTLSQMIFTAVSPFPADLSSDVTFHCLSLDVSVSAPPSPPPAVLVSCFAFSLQGFAASSAGLCIRM